MWGPRWTARISIAQMFCFVKEVYEMDLWPSDIADRDAADGSASGVGGGGSSRAPVAFLCGWASLLCEKPGGLVEGWVVVGGDVPRARMGGGRGRDASLALEGKIPIRQARPYGWEGRGDQKPCYCILDKDVPMR